MVGQTQHLEGMRGTFLYQEYVSYLNENIINGGRFGEREKQLKTFLQLILHLMTRSPNIQKFK